MQFLNTEYVTFSNLHLTAASQLIVLIILLIVVSDCRADPAVEGMIRSDSIIERLTLEFNGSLPLKVALSGTTHQIELRASEFESGILPPYRARLWGYNRQIPGPVIRIGLGDSLEVTLTNDLAQPTSIHWHGIRVPNSMDGVPGITQQAVAAGQKFIYRFTPKDPGTFWFHPHIRSAEQVEKGLQGVLIVEDPEEPPYSRELVWILDDWLLQPDGTIYDQFVTRHELAHDGRWGNVMTINAQYRPSFQVRPGERIRVRMVNVANGRVFAPTISGVEDRVIAVDGLRVAESFPLANFPLAPGNRIDLDIVIPKEFAGSSLSILDTYPGTDNVLGTIAVDADGFVETPRFAPPLAHHFPKWLDAEQAPIDHEFLLDAKRGGPYGISWTIDGRAWPEHQSVELVSKRFYRLRFKNLTGRLHPMHIHGQFFRLIARDGQSANEAFWRDTVLVGPEQSVDVALVPIDNGDWANHCHILEHAEAGMMGVIRVK